MCRSSGGTSTTIKMAITASTPIISISVKARRDRRVWKLFIFGGPGSSDQVAAVFIQGAVVRSQRVQQVVLRDRRRVAGVAMLVEVGTLVRPKRVIVHE